MTFYTGPVAFIALTPFAFAGTLNSIGRTLTLTLNLTLTLTRTLNLTLTRARTRTRALTLTLTFTLTLTLTPTLTLTLTLTLALSLSLSLTLTLPLARRVQHHGGRLEPRAHDRRRLPARQVRGRGRVLGVRVGVGVG